MKRIVHSIIALLFCLPMVAQEKDSVATDSLSNDDVQSSLIFLSRDKSSIGSYFGHIALRLQCPSKGLDYVFSFEGNGTATFYELVSGIKLLAYLPVETQKYFSYFESQGRKRAELPINLTQKENQDLWRLVDKYVAQHDYLNNDYLNNGCAQETASIIRAVIKGRIVYGNYVEHIKKTQRTIAGREIDKGTWFHLFLFMFASEDCDQPISVERRLFLPTDMVNAWQEAQIETEDGTLRPLLKPTSVNEAAFQVPESLFPITYWVFGIMLLITLILSLWQLTGKKEMQKVAWVLDAVLLTSLSATAVSFIVFYTIATTPSMSGWNQHFLVFNLIPLLVWTVTRKRNLNPRQWITVYGIYTTVLLYMLTWMLMNTERIDSAEYLIISILLIRCLMRIKMNYKSQLKTQ